MPRCDSDAAALVVNFARDISSRQSGDAVALIERSRDSRRVVWTFDDIERASGALSGHLATRGVGRGDVVMTLVGNRPEWVLAMVACFRIGAVVLSCNEQLRSKDLAERIELAAPKAVVVDARNLDELRRVGSLPPILVVPDESLLIGQAAPYVDLDAGDPCLLTFTSGTEGLAKGVLHKQAYLMGQSLQAEHWLGAEPGDVVWCTAASGWSKSARNVFIAPWLRGASGLLLDQRFDSAERLSVLAEERVNVLCMAPTEYRVIAKRETIGRFPDLRGLVAAGEALNPEVIATWKAATGLEIRDGFGQTETGQLTGNPVDEPIRAGSMGRPLPGIRAWIDDGELVVDPRTVPTFFHGYLGQEPASKDEPWRTGDKVYGEDGWLYFEGRADDVIVSSGYRIGPFEVESALLSHRAVAEAAVVGAPDAERGEIVRAVVVLGDGWEPGGQLERELQEHVRSVTAPYKYPRQVDFVRELPKTSTGKVRRAALRRG